MQVTLHAPGSDTRGWGHFFRLCALGEGLLSAGHEVFFSVTNRDPQLSLRAANLGFRTSSPTSKGQHSSWVSIVDDYEPDVDFFRQLQESGSSIIQIVDSGTRRRLEDATFIRPDPLLLGDGDLSGLSYALIARDVRCRKWTSRSSARPQVAVAIGGTGERLNREVTRILGELDCADFVDARQLMSQDLVDRSSFLDCISESTFAVVGAGTMLWECCAMGVPTLALSVIENQRSQAHWAAENRLCLTAGIEDTEAMLLQFEALSHDEVLRREISKRGPGVIDGRGVDRVVDFLQDRFGRG